LTGTGHGPFARTPASQKSMHGLLRSRSGEAGFPQPVESSAPGRTRSHPAEAG